MAALIAEKSALAKTGPAPGPDARFQQVRNRVAALFQQRNQPPADPVPEENPFRAPGSGTAPPAAESERIAPSKPTERVLLQQAVATLRVSGTFEKDGEAYLVINAKPYRIGDVLQATVQREVIYLRVRKIERNSVTLALNDTEVTLKHDMRVWR